RYQYRHRQHRTRRQGNPVEVGGQSEVGGNAPIASGIQGAPHDFPRQKCDHHQADRSGQDYGQLPPAGRKRIGEKFNCDMAAAIEGVWQGKPDYPTHGESYGLPYAWDASAKLSHHHVDTGSGPHGKKEDDAGKQAKSARHLSDKEMQPLAEGPWRSRLGCPNAVQVVPIRFTVRGESVRRNTSAHRRYALITG